MNDSESTIFGRVMDAETKRPMSGMLVRAVDVAVEGADDHLGSTKTDQRGQFRIRFPRAARGNSDQRGPDVVLEVFDAQSGQLLHSTRDAVMLDLRVGESKIDLLVPTNSSLQPPVVAALGASAEALRGAGITNLRHLRRVARSPDALARLKLDPNAEKAIRQFASLTAVFPSTVAAVLQGMGASDVNQLVGWDDRELQARLEKGGMDREVVHYQTTRFRQLKALLAQGAEPERVTGIHVDLGTSRFGSEEDRRTLAEAGVETLADWAARRSDIEVARETAAILDAYTRLSSLRIAPDLIKMLFEAEIRGAQDLVLTGERRAAEVARRAGVTPEEVKQWQLDAYDRLAELLRDIRAIRIDGGATPGAEQPDPNLHGCEGCPDEHSVFSRFAYFIYLVRKTQASLGVIDETLHQALKELSPYDCYESLPQVEICRIVLSRAFPSAWQDDDQMLVDRLRVMRRLALSPLTIDEAATAAAHRMGGGNAQDLAARLRDSLDAGLTDAHPAFAAAERQALSDVIDTHLVAISLPFLKIKLAKLVELVQTDIPTATDLKERVAEAFDMRPQDATPVFSEEELASLRLHIDTNLDQRGQQRIVEPQRHAELAATVLQRDLLKQRTGKTDRELYEQLLIETDLDACEIITRIDQAIRSVQALLDSYISNKEDAQSRENFTYNSYEVWRADRIAVLFPEIGALFRGDALVGDSGSWDRGSFLWDHRRQTEQLTEQLQLVRAAIQEARLSSVDEGSSAGFDSADFKKLTRFDQTPYFQHFLAGVDLIEKFLAANSQIVDAHRHIDHDRAGVAIRELEDALHALDDLAVAASIEGSRWRVPSQRQFDELLAIGPTSRQALVGELAHRLEVDSKDVYEPLVDLRQVEGLGPTGRFLDEDVLSQPATKWKRPGPATFDLRTIDSTVTLLKKKPNDGADEELQRRVYYADNDLAANYTVQMKFKLPETLEVGQAVGLGIRVREDPVTGKLSGYQVILKRHLESEAMSSGGLFPGPDDGDTVNRWRYYLHLQRIHDEAGVELGGEEDRVEVLALPETNPRALYTMTLTANGSRIAGSLSFVLNPQSPEFFEIERTGIPFSAGSVGVMATHAAHVEFHTIKVDVRNVSVAIPFQAKRRFERPIVALDNLRDHLWWQGPTGIELPHNLTLDSLDYTFIERGLASGEVDPLGRWLVFPPGMPGVDIEALDETLERCFEGMFYLRHAAVPVALSRAYLQTGDFQRALDMLRLVYDPGGEGVDVYTFLGTPSATLVPGLDARLMRLRIADVLLQWATWLFRENTADSRAGARRKLREVLRLHGDENACQCDAAINEVTESLLATVRKELIESADGKDAVAAIIDLMVEPLVDEPMLEETLPSPFPPETDHLRQLEQLRADLEGRLAIRRRTLAGRNTLAALSRKTTELIDHADVSFAAKREDGFLHRVLETKLRNGARYRRQDRPTAKGNRNLVVDAYIPSGRYELFFEYLDFTLCVPANPVIRMQRRQACLLLDQLLYCRNILGYRDELVPALRYETLDRIASGYADLALASERDLLNFRREAEAAHLSLMQATQELAVSSSSLAIEQTKQEEAASQTRLALLQKSQAIGSMAHLDELIATGLSEAEIYSMRALGYAMAFTIGGGIINIFGGILGPATSGGNPLLSIASGGLNILGSAASTGAQVSEQLSRLYSMQASFERREQEWRYQLAIGRLGVSIANESLQQAQTRQLIARQQLELAQFRHDFATDGLNFLDSRFLNEAMLVWLTQTVREEYQKRLNYAINAAYMAERALSFELQEQHRLIRFDYFDPQRDGLLGATQLITDLATLRNKKLAATERKLQLSKTISLRSEMPIEFQRFKTGTTGQLPFATLMKWFDSDFPGHYLRLIKSVRVTVLALIPPNSGIRATLSNSGISTVVKGPPTFEATTIRRDPEAVALSSFYQATGVFSLDYASDLLLPFEGSGVETDWVFELPKAANPIDFDSIADVLLTIDYTALSDGSYRQRVVKELGSATHADRLYSVRHQLPDEWYHLHNTTAADSLRVRIDVEPNAFPPNVSDIKMEHLALLLDWKDGFAQEADVILRFQPQGSPNATELPALTTQNGLARTRSSGALQWAQLIEGQSPFGKWEITLEGPPEIRKAIEEARLNDMLFAITYRAITPR